MVLLGLSAYSGSDPIGERLGVVRNDRRQHHELGPAGQPRAQVREPTDIGAVGAAVRPDDQHPVGVDVAGKLVAGDQFDVTNRQTGAVAAKPVGDGRRVVDHRTDATAFPERWTPSRSALWDHVLVNPSWVFPPADTADEHGVVGIGADVRPVTLLTAYRSGLFPMPIESEGTLAWYSPDPRAIIPIGGMHISRSLRRSIRRFWFTVDADFATVMHHCGDPQRQHGWIDRQMLHGYTELHRAGHAHSLEAWNDAGELVGGVYGVSIGGFFAGESMFHRERDASKAALAALLVVLEQLGYRLFDTQWLTDHLASLGAVEVPRDEYLGRLADACDVSVGPISSLGPFGVNLRAKTPIEVL